MNEQKENKPLTKDILPCPFCGDNDLILEESKSPDKTVTWYQLHHGPTTECSVSFINSNKERLIELWNKRNVDIKLATSKVELSFPLNSGNEMWQMAREMDSQEFINYYHKLLREI